MNRLFAASLAALGTVGACQAAEVGVGVSMKHSENSIYFPIELRQNLALEGRVNYSHMSGDDSHYWREKNTDLLLGIALFGRQKITEASRIYYGPRISYVLRKNTSDRFDMNEWHHSTYKTHGYNIEPTFGFEYFPVKNVSIGGEVGLIYSKVNNNTVSEYAYGYNKLLWTTSSIIVRTYF